VRVPRIGRAVAAVVLWLALGAAVTACGISTDSQPRPIRWEPATTTTAVPTTTSTTP
jgi:hypothetical protein